MNTLHALFTSGRVIDLVIALIVLEAVVLRMVRRGATTLPMSTLLAGIGLLLAWRFSMSGWPWAYVALALTAAGCAHGVELWRLWRSR